MKKSKIILYHSIFALLGLIGIIGYFFYKINNTSHIGLAVTGTTVAFVYMVGFLIICIISLIISLIISHFLK